MFKNKFKLAASSFVILLPAIIGTVIRDSLPDTVITHFGTNGKPDAMGSVEILIYVVPLILLVLHWLCLFVTSKDKGNKSQNPKIISMVTWIIPLISVTVYCIMYAGISGEEVSFKAMFILFALMFIVLGNYLPKCKQNSTIGIKLPWTLADEENWAKTHRFSGKVWVVSGILMFSLVFLDATVAFIVFSAILLVCVAICTLYSFLLARKQKSAGTFTQSKTMSKGQKITTAVITVLSVIFVGVICLTGDIEITCTDTDIIVAADYSEDLKIPFTEIEKAEYKENFTKGIRIMGFNSPRLSTGTFENEDFDRYTLYAYTDCPDAIIIYADGEEIALSLEDAQKTENLYNQIMEKVK